MIDTRKSIPFKEFDRLVSQFAHMLERLDIQKEDRIVLLLPPSLEYYVSMFGTLKRGAVVVPCSPLFGPEAISFRIENSEGESDRYDQEDGELD